MNEGADTTFVRNLQNVNVRAYPDHTFYVGTVHDHNTSPKRTETIGWRPLPNGEASCLMDDEDWVFYESFSILARKQLKLSVLGGPLKEGRARFSEEMTTQ